MSTIVHFRVDGEPGCGAKGPSTGILGNVTCAACRELEAFNDVRSAVGAVNQVESRRAPR
jgi:hypothetical protein